MLLVLAACDWFGGSLCGYVAGSGLPAHRVLVGSEVRTFHWLSTTGRISYDSISAAWVRTVWPGPPFPFRTPAENEPDTPQQQGLCWCAAPLCAWWTPHWREARWLLFLFPDNICLLKKTAAQYFQPFHCWSEHSANPDPTGWLPPKDLHKCPRPSQGELITLISLVHMEWQIASPGVHFHLWKCKINVLFFWRPLSRLLNLCHNLSQNTSTIILACYLDLCYLGSVTQHSLQLGTSSLSNTLFFLGKFDFFFPLKKSSMLFLPHDLNHNLYEKVHIWKGHNRSFQILFDPWWPCALDFWSRNLVQISIMSKRLKNYRRDSAARWGLKDWNWVKGFYGPVCCRSPVPVSPLLTPGVAQMFFLKLPGWATALWNETHLLGQGDEGMD